MIDKEVLGCEVIKSNKGKEGQKCSFKYEWLSNDYVNIKKSKEIKYPTNYSKKNESEFFAECFMLYYLGKLETKINQWIKTKFRFVCREFSGCPWDVVASISLVTSSATH